MDDSPPPDRFTKRLRFGCGFVFGGGIAFLVVLATLLKDSGSICAIVALAAVVSGFLAARYGQDFFLRLSNFFRSLFYW